MRYPWWTGIEILSEEMKQWIMYKQWIMRIVLHIYTGGNTLLVSVWMFRAHCLYLFLSTPLARRRPNGSIFLLALCPSYRINWERAVNNHRRNCILYWPQIVVGRAKLPHKWKLEAGSTTRKNIDCTNPVHTTSRLLRRPPFTVVGPCQALAITRRTITRSGTGL